MLLADEVQSIFPYYSALEVSTATGTINIYHIRYYSAYNKYNNI